MEPIAAGLVMPAMFLVGALGACPECRALVEAGIRDHDLVRNLLVLFMPVAILLALGVVAYFADVIESKLRGGTGR
jgi:hypothetical protein